VVLPRGTTFVVHGVRRIHDDLYENDHWVVEVEVVPADRTPHTDGSGTSHGATDGLPSTETPAPVPDPRAEDRLVAPAGPSRPLP
jgi:hypothetical protein